MQQSLVASDFLRRRVRMLEEDTIELPGGRSKHFGGSCHRVGVTQFLTHDLHGLFGAPVSALFEILIRQTPDLVRRTMLVDDKRGQPLHSARSAAILKKDFNGQVDCRSSAQAGQDAPVTDTELVVDR